MGEHAENIQISMLAQTGGTVCAPVLHGNEIHGPVTVKCVIYGGPVVSSINTVQAGGSPVVPALTEGEMSSFTISSSKDCTTISLCDGMVTVLIKPRPAGPEALEKETSRIIREVLRAHVDRKNRSQCRTRRVMNRLVKIFIMKISSINDMVQNLPLEDHDDDMSFVSILAKQILSYEPMTWRRIISLVAVGAVLCERLKNMGRDPCVEDVAGNISTYLNTHQHQWLINNNGWDGFMELFAVKDQDLQQKSPGAGEGAEPGTVIINTLSEGTTT